MTHYGGAQDGMDPSSPSFGTSVVRHAFLMQRGWALALPANAAARSGVGSDFGPTQRAM